MQQVTDINIILNGLSESVGLILPELILTTLVFILVLYELFRKGPQQLFLMSICVFGLALAMFAAFRQFNLTTTGGIDGFSGLFRLDRLSVFFRILFLGSGIIFLVMSLNDRKQELKEATAEYYMVFIGILIGSSMLISANNLLSVYISIELISLSSYIVTVFNFNRSSLEAGLKYLLFGALSSGIMLYGMSLLYGFTGGLEFSDPSFLLALKSVPNSRMY